MEFDKTEFNFARSLLENKGTQDWKIEQEIPDSEVIKFFEEEKKRAVRKLKKQQKIQRTKELEKHKEQERIVAEKAKKFFEEENSKISLI